MLVEGFESTEFLLFVKWLLSADNVDDEPPGVPFRDTSECDLPELPEPDPVLLLLLLFRFPPPEDVLVLDLEPIGLEFTLFSDMLLRKSFCRPLFLLLNQEQEGKRYINRVKKLIITINRGVRTCYWFYWHIYYFELLRKTAGLNYS